MQILNLFAGQELDYLATRGRYLHVQVVCDNTTVYGVRWGRGLQDQYVIPRARGLDFQSVGSGWDLLVLQCCNDPGRVTNNMISLVMQPPFFVHRDKYEVVLREQSNLSSVIGTRWRSHACRLMVHQAPKVYFRNWSIHASGLQIPFSNWAPPGNTRSALVSSGVCIRLQEANIDHDVT